MKQFLKVYDITLRVCGPVFIGSGQEIGKKEYIRIPEQGKVLIPDLPGMYGFLKKRGLARAYEDYLMDSKAVDLFSWLRQRNIRLEDMREWTSYTLDCGDAVFDRGKQIKTFVKDAYGCPYIPGSSLKGMLRTILIAEDYRRHPERFAQVREEIRRNVGKPADKKKYLKNETDRIEEIAFHKNLSDRKKEDMTSDILAGMIVSDSMPLSIDDLTLCQKIDYHVHGMERRLPILRECLKPETEVHFTLSIDQEIHPVIPVRYLRAAIDEFAKQYDRVFLSRFPNTAEPSGNTVWLGGGAGFVSKTVLYNLFGREQGLELVPKIFEKTGVPQMHGHKADGRHGVSPHILKITKYMGKSYQFGECRIFFREVN